MLKRTNPLLRTDTYKYSHWKQYPPHTTMIESYIESRGADGLVTSDLMFFGLQYHLNAYLGDMPTHADNDAAAQFAAKHFGRDDIYPHAGFKRIIDLGYYPVTIDALPEGAIVPLHNIVARIRSTDPQTFWAVSWLETQLIRAIWYPTTVATNSLSAKRIIYKNLVETSDDPDGEIGFKLHDFAARGASSRESAALGGAAHLLNFLGTDTAEGIELLRLYYGADMPGFSIPASEHSTITTWGQGGEVDAFANMIKQFAKPGTLVACVSDSFDIFAAAEHLWGEQLHDQVVESGAIIVVRPDSGEPDKVVLQLLDILGNKFGYTINSKGFKVLNHVRVIQGDGMTPALVRYLYDRMKHFGWAGSNVAVGMGGGLYNVKRDTLKWADKVSLALVGGEMVHVFKQPVTADFKKSRSGHLDLIINPQGLYETVDRSKAHGAYGGVPSQLVRYYADGALTNVEDFTVIRSRADAAFKQTFGT